jgi:hypothetical protein
MAACSSFRSLGVAAFTLPGMAVILSQAQEKDYPCFNAIHYSD